MARPRIENTISTGQIVTAVLLSLITGGGAWIAIKDRNDVDLGAKIDQQAKVSAEQNAALVAQIARMDGKLEAYGVSFNSLSGQVSLLDQRVKSTEDAMKEGRQERSAFQRETEARLGQLEQRVGVMEALRPR
jgi:uncharacterized protein YceH (UPF0502 family)